MTTFRTSAVAVLLACTSAALLAAPAPWFKWRSKTDGKVVCHQTALGAGWEKADGPYRDSHCMRLLIAK